MREQGKHKASQLLVGVQDFSLFIGKKAAFVDKTEIIRDLINESPGPYFLARPRCFGNTLLMDR
jgi:hypothetical protein